VGGFCFLTDAELLTFDVVGMPADSPMGYFVECNLRYPAELHALHNAYPLAPEHVYILEEMLSDMVRLMQDVTGVAHFPCTKLVSNLHDKTCYITHYRCLQFYLAHGLVLDKIHRVVAFTQSIYMLPFIKFCNNGRKKAKSEFESSYKLIANAFYGKTVENVQKRANDRLIADPAKFVRSVLKASYKHSSITNADLAMVENFCTHTHTHTHTHTPTPVTGGALRQPCVNSHWLSLWEPCIFDPTQNRSLLTDH